MVGFIRSQSHAMRTMHINGFTGGPTVYPTPNSTIGQFNDGGVVFGPENVLFVTRFPYNQLEQSKPGSIDPDKVTDLTTLGIDSSVGSIGFVPSGFPGAGSMKIVRSTPAVVSLRVCSGRQRHV